MTYFFKDIYYYRFNDADFEVNSLVSASHSSSSLLTHTLIVSSSRALLTHRRVRVAAVTSHVERREQVDSKAKPAFPRQTSVWWFDCKSAQNTPLGLSAELRAPLFVTNDSLAVESTSPPAASYSSHLLLVDKEHDVEILQEQALAGHRASAGERSLTHESESLARNAGPVPTSMAANVAVILSLLCLSLCLSVLAKEPSSF